MCAARIFSCLRGNKLIGRSKRNVDSSTRFGCIFSLLFVRVRRTECGERMLSLGSGSGLWEVERDAVDE